MIKLAAVARGDVPADVVIRNARVANVFTLNYELADVAIVGGVIAGISPKSSERENEMGYASVTQQAKQGYSGRVNYDAQGRVLIPGLIDGHVHIEDTMMTPQNFAATVSLHGTTAVMADPHEIANCLGMAGIEYMHRASQGLPVDIFYGAPSCVPASEYEDPYEELGMPEIQTMFNKGLTQHLGEMMNYLGIINGDGDAWGKVLAAGNVPITGHAPLVTGKALNAYIAAGISSDHESTTLDEAHEKLARGMWLMIREGASFNDLRTLLPLIKENPLAASRCMVVSDDITARYLVEQGHMDAKMRIMLKEGINPFVALRMVTLSPAEYFRLYNRGSIAPGKIADFILLESNEIDEKFDIHSVWKNGHLIAKDDDIFTLEENELVAPVVKVRVKNIPEDIRVKAHSNYINVIKLTPGTVITNSIEYKAKIKNGYVEADPKNDIAKVIVLERHHDTGRFGVGFVQGMGIKKGALASSVAHDAHNFIAVGVDDESILTALKELANLGGGLVVADGSKVTGSFGLPIAGLMSYRSPEETAAELTKMENCAQDLGVKVAHPFMVMSFLQLTVIPELRITNRGYINLERGGIQPLFIE